MSVWVNVVIAFGSGSIGAQLSAWYKARADRQDRFRDLMIAAADAFGVATSEAFIALRDAQAVANKGRPEDVEPACRTAWSKRDAVLSLTPRIDLLLGPGSQAGLLASGVTTEL